MATKKDKRIIEKARKKVKSYFCMIEGKKDVEGLVEEVPSQDRKVEIKEE